MESLAFTLQLVDKVSAGAKRSADGLRGVQTAATKAKASLDFSKETARAQAALNRLRVDPKGFEALQKMKSEHAALVKQLRGGGPSQAEGFRASVGRHAAFGAATGAILVEGIARAGDILIEAGRKVVDLVTEGFKKALDVGSKQEVLKLGEKFSLGAGAKEFREDVDRFAKQTGFDDDDIRKMLLPLRRAGFSQQAARSAFAAAGDIAVGLGEGGNQSTVKEALDVFAKIQLKGGIASKQLVGLGASPKGVYADIAKQLGISKAAAEKKVTSGDIDDPQRILNAIFSGIEKTQGAGLGTATNAYPKTLEGIWKKITELPDNYFKKLESTPAWEKITAAAGRFMEMLSPDSPSGQRIFAGLERAFESIVGWIDELASEEGIGAFASGLQTALDVLNGMFQTISLVVDMFKEAIKVAEQVSAPIAKIISIGQGAGYGKAIGMVGEKTATAGVGYAAFARMWGLDEAAAAKPAGANSKTSVSAPVQVNIHGAGGNPEEHGKRAGKAASEEISRRIERTAQEAGQ